MLDALWELCRHDLLIDKETFINNLTCWEIKDFDRFMRVNKGGEVHFISKHSGNATRQDIRDCVQPIIDKYGFAETFTPISNTRQQRLNKFLGFVETWRDENHVHFRIERLRHV